ncbi:hypothetical protein GY45DRAFT_1326449 [Cubamyces sp. BRFM 1775]|nr:hypothetical protein GY45DRAFT_1326449 [Cubamyces sp. BRFM 1775]
MKFSVASILAAALSVQAFALPIVTSEHHVENRAAETCGYTAVALLRGYSPSASDHFYTTNAGEMENAILNIGYFSEGDGAQVLPSQAPTLSRSTAYHFYTTNAAERAIAISQLGYTDEGIAAYVYPSKLCGSVPLYRMYNPMATDHFYTTNVGERDNAITALGYVDEGIAAYVNPSQ